MTIPAPLVWYARGKGIARIGPYYSQARAWKAVRSEDGNPMLEAIVWCELDIKEFKKCTCTCGASTGCKR